MPQGAGRPPHGGPPRVREAAVASAHVCAQACRLQPVSMKARGNQQTGAWQEPGDQDRTVGESQEQMQYEEDKWYKQAEHCKLGGH